MFSLLLLNSQFVQASGRELGVFDFNPLSPVFWAQRGIDEAKEVVRKTVQAQKEQRQQKAFNALGFTAKDWERLIKCDHEFNQQVQELKNMDLFKKMECDKFQSTSEGKTMWQKYEDYEQKYGHRRLSYEPSFTEQEWDRLMICNAEFAKPAEIREMMGMETFNENSCDELKTTPEGQAMWQKYQKWYNETYGHRRLSYEPSFTEQEWDRLMMCNAEFGKPAEIREIMGMDTFNENRCDELKTTPEGQAMWQKYQKWYNETYLANRVAHRQLGVFDFTPLAPALFAAEQAKNGTDSEKEAYGDIHV